MFRKKTGGGSEFPTSNWTGKLEGLCVHQEGRGGHTAHLGTKHTAVTITAVGFHFITLIASQLIRAGSCLLLKAGAGLLQPVLGLPWRSPGIPHPESLCWEGKKKSPSLLPKQISSVSEGMDTTHLSGNCNIYYTGCCVSRGISQSHRAAQGWSWRGSACNHPPAPHTRATYLNQRHFMNPLLSPCSSPAACKTQAKHRIGRAGRAVPCCCEFQSILNPSP